MMDDNICNAIIKTRHDLMVQFKEGRTNEWKPDMWIADFEEMTGEVKAKEVAPDKQVNHIDEGLGNVTEAEGANADEVGEGRINSVPEDTAVLALAVHLSKEPTIQKDGRANTDDQVEKEAPEEKTE
ncbi:hypothetical protein ACOSQ3_022689 [Xanthoceras sorbifolium]